MSIEEILDDMDELLDKASSIPFQSHKAVIDGDRLRELINDVRLNIPQEIKHAKMVEFDRDRIIKEAEAKAEQIVRHAEARAKVLVSEDTITREAKKRALEAVTKAKSESDAIRAAAKSESEAIHNATNAYVLNSFQEVEAFLSANLKDVQNRKGKFEQLKRKGSQAAQPASASADTEK